MRELREETGLRAVTDELTEAGSYQFEENRRHITAHVFAWRPGAPAAPMADQREIVWAGYLTAGSWLASH